MAVGLHKNERAHHKTRQNALRRLRSAKGHLEGVLRMLEDPRIDSVDVMKQLSAVQGALRKVNTLVLRWHVRDQVTTVVLGGSAEEVVEDLIEVLKYRC